MKQGMEAVINYILEQPRLEQKRLVQRLSNQLIFLKSLDYLAEHVQRHRTNVDDGEHWLVGTSEPIYPRITSGGPHERQDLVDAIYAIVTESREYELDADDCGAIYGGPLDDFLAWISDGELLGAPSQWMVEHYGDGERIFD